MMSNKFSDTFRRELEDIKGRAAMPGVGGLKAICKAAGIARATPDRWLAKTPNTIQAMDKLQAAANRLAPKVEDDPQNHSPSEKVE